MQHKFPSTKYIKEDFEKFIPEGFKNKILNPDSSYESEEENPMNKLQEEETHEFYNIVRNIFSSANISLNNEQLYSPFLEALIKNYSKRLNHLSTGKPGPKRVLRKATSRLNLPANSPNFKYEKRQVHLLDMKSSKSINEIWTQKDIKARSVILN